MSSSSSAVRTGPRVLRAELDQRVAPTALLQLDLAPAGLARLDPERVDAAVEEGRAAGYEAGRAAGHADGLARASAEQAAVTAALRAQLAGAVQAAEAALSDALARVADAAVEAADATSGAALAIAEAVVGRELATAVAPGRDAVARALALAPEGVAVALRLHPADADALGAAELGSGRTLTIVPDPSIAPGDCIADAGWTRIDARISAALERVRAVLETTP